MAIISAVAWRLVTASLLLPQLVSAGFNQGMSKQTQVYAVADGGNGLREALQMQFPNLTFILDRPHLKQHLYEGAEAIGLTSSERHKWVSDNLHKIDFGEVRKLLRLLRDIGVKDKSASLIYFSISSDLEMLLIMINFVQWVYLSVLGKLKALTAIFPKNA